MRESHDLVPTFHGVHEVISNPNHFPAPANRDEREREGSPRSPSASATCHFNSNRNPAPSHLDPGSGKLEMPMPISDRKSVRHPRPVRESSCHTWSFLPVAWFLSDWCFPSAVHPPLFIRLQHFITRGLLRLSTFFLYLFLGSRR